MREIKFRGKSIDRRSDNFGKWIYGGYSVGKRGQLYITVGTIGQLVNPNTVGQFTGVFDADGNEIYEGDILTQAYNDDVHLLVVYDICDAAFKLRLVNNDSYYFDDVLYTEREYVVVGNIHDTPELLEQ